MARIERALEILEIVLAEDPTATIWAMPLILMQMDDEPWASLPRSGETRRPVA